MDKHDTPRRGRPRKVLPDASGEPSIPTAPDDAHRDGEIGFREPETDRSPAPSRWADVIAKINALSGSGMYVTQLHTRDNRTGQYELENGHAVINGNQEEDFLVTSDGVKHPV
jgi:hypothetical protein